MLLHLYILCFFLGRLRCTTTFINMTFTTDLESASYSAVRYSCGFVDKTLFLEHWLDIEQRILFVSAPAGFGKSTLADMQTTFFNAQYDVINGEYVEKERSKTDTYQAFKDLKIFKERPPFFKKNFMKYTVIKLKFRELHKVNSESSFKTELCRTIADMVQPFEYLLHCKNVPENLKAFIREYGSTSSLYCYDNFERTGRSTGALGEFVELLNDLFGKPVIIIGDEYDGFIQANILQNIPDPICTAISSHLESFIYPVAKDDSLATIIKKVYFTGTLNLGGPLSVVNTGTHKDFCGDESLGSFYGLTTSEVQTLLQNFSMGAHFNAVQSQFGGYAVIGSPLRLFNTASVVKYLKYENLEDRSDRAHKELWTSLPNDFFLDYRVGSWVARASSLNEPRVIVIETIGRLHFRNVNGLKPFLAKRGSKATFLSLYQVSMFFTYLIQCGLFTVMKEDTSRSLMYIRSPNREVDLELKELLHKSNYHSTRFNETETLQIELEDAIRYLDTDQGSVERFGNATFMMFKDHPPNCEKNYRSIIIAHFDRIAKTEPRVHTYETNISMDMTKAGEKETKKENTEVTGKGRLDLIFFCLERELVVFIEFKYYTNGYSGLRQIFDGRYFDVLETRATYQRYKKFSSVMIGLSVTRKGSVSMSYVINSNMISDAHNCTLQPKFERSKKNTPSKTKTPKI